MLRSYIGIYSDERASACDVGRRSLLGIEALADMPREPFVWPAAREAKRAIIHLGASSPTAVAPTPEVDVATVVAAQETYQPLEIKAGGLGVNVRS